MAVGNYGLVVDTSNFKPYTFEELAAPFLLYKLDYEKMQDKVEKMNEEFGKFTVPKDSIYYEPLLLFRDEYKKVAEDVTKGLTLANSAKMRDLFIRAQRDIAPIREAVVGFNKRQDDIKKIKATNPSAIIKQPKVDDFYGGNVPPLDYISGDAIKEDTAKLIASLASEEGSQPEILDDLNNYYVTIRLGGMSSDSLDALKKAITSLRTNLGQNITLEENATLNKFEQALQGVYNKTGVLSWGDNDSANKVISNIVEGAMQGIPPVKYSMLRGAGMSEYERKHIDAQDAANRNAFIVNMAKLGLNPDGTPMSEEKLKAMKKARSAGKGVSPKPVYKKVTVGEGGKITFSDYDPRVTPTSVANGSKIVITPDSEWEKLPESVKTAITNMCRGLKNNKNELISGKEWFEKEIRGIIPKGGDLAYGVTGTGNESRLIGIDIQEESEDLRTLYEESSD